MIKSDEYKLCGGTFFVLISKARRKMPNYDERYRGISSGLTEPELLWGLTRCAIPDLSRPTRSEQQTVKDSTRDFKMCTGTGGNFYRLGEKSIQTTFDREVKGNYSAPLSAMVQCVGAFLDVDSGTKNDEYLVKALIEVIEQDSDINDNQEFYVCEDGSTMTKIELCSSKELCLQSFLLGVWHFVITQVDNNVGQTTYEKWCPARGGAQRECTATIGEDSTRELKLTYCDENLEVEEENEPYEEEYIEPEVVEFEKEKTVQQNVTNPIVFNFSQIGSNNTQIGSITNYYAGKEKMNGE